VTVSETVTDPAKVLSRPGGKQGRRRSDAPDQGRGPWSLDDADPAAWGRGHRRYPLRRGPCV